MISVEEKIRNFQHLQEVQPAMTDAGVTEIMSHLHESMAGVCGKGWSEEESLLGGAHRVGPPAEINTEFPKVNGGRLWTSRLI